MKLSLLEKYGFIEVFSRVTLANSPKLKKIAKKLRASKNNSAEVTEKKDIDPKWATEYFTRIEQLLSKGDIVLIHSSMDGLEAIGITAEAFIDFMESMVERLGVTFVLPCFPITNLKLPTAKSRPYDLKKTLCWTGMLPNAFIGNPNVIRSAFPYNSLAAMGPKAEEMMAHSFDATYVYDTMSPWRYCLDNDAKILFVGVKASGSNTMGIHMVPDVMGQDWPVKDWYEDRTYKVRIDGEVVEKPIKVQADHWYNYCMEERTSGRLKSAGVLIEEDVCGCNLGVVKSSKEMVTTLTQLCKKGKLMYMIPRRYLK